MAVRGAWAPVPRNYDAPRSGVRVLRPRVPPPSALAVAEGVTPRVVHLVPFYSSRKDCIADGGSVR